MKHRRAVNGILVLAIALFPPLAFGAEQPETSAGPVAAEKTPETPLLVAVSDSYYAFDEGVGALAADASGCATGTLEGAAWVAGKINTALRFDGKDDFVSLGPLEILDQDFTITAWVKPTAVVERNIRAVVSKERAFFEGHQFCLYVGHHNRIGFRMSGERKDAVSIETIEDKLPVNQWSHLAVTRYGPHFVLYQDGRAVAEATVNANIRHENHVDMRIGASYPAEGKEGYRCFNGLIDEVRIRNAVLFPSEIAAEIARDEATAYHKAAEWDRSSVDTRWGDFLVELTPFCSRPGAYEILFERTGGNDNIEIRSARARTGGTEQALAPDPANPHRFRIEVGAPDLSVRLATSVRGAGGNDTRGEVLVRPAP